MCTTEENERLRLHKQRGDACKAEDLWGAARRNGHADVRAPLLVYLRYTTTVAGAVLY